MFGYYYNNNIRKIVVAFGSLFNDIHVAHKNPDGGNNLDIRVPITYASQEKFIQRYLNPSSITDGTRIENQLPRMSYIMASVAPDPSRRRSRFATTLGKETVGIQGTCTPTGKAVYNEIPVNLTFNLFIYTRHTDDTMQIVEQIMPYFVPDHTIQLDMNEVNRSIQIPIVMAANNLNSSYDGDFGNRRVNISSFSFVAKGYIFGKIVDTTVISDTAGITLDILNEYQ
jgi:hypothetical protein